MSILRNTFNNKKLFFLTNSIPILNQCLVLVTYTNHDFNPYPPAEGLLRQSAVYMFSIGDSYSTHGILHCLLPHRNAQSNIIPTRRAPSYFSDPSETALDKNKSHFLFPRVSPFSPTPENDELLLPLEILFS